MTNLLTSIHASDADPVVLIQAGVLAPGSPEAKRRFAARAQGFPGRADTMLIQAGVLAPGSPEAKRRFAARAQGFPGRADTTAIFGGNPQRMLADVQSKLRGRT